MVSQAKHLQQRFSNFFENEPFTKEGIFKALRKAADAYYNTAEQLISDSLYDDLAIYYENTFFEELPVGAPVTIGNILELSHSYTDFAGTLSKCKNIDELKQWLKSKKIKAKELLGVSLKADGFSITVEWVAKKKGNSVTMVIDKALTRGEDGVGKDLTALFKANQHIVPVPDIDFDCAIGYEGVVTFNAFNRFKEENGDVYKNSRSILGGIISASGMRYFGDFVTLIPIRIKARELVNQPSREAFMEWANNLDTTLDFEPYCTIDTIEEIYNSIQEVRDSGNEFANFMCDGLVIEVMDEELREKLGFTSTHPNFATALKFKPIRHITTVTDVKWSVEGISGVFTPVVHFKPVVVRGNTYKQVSIANYGRFMSMELRLGDEIEFELRHDTLGYISKLDSEYNTTNKRKKFSPPNHCDACQSELLTDGTFLACYNSECRYNLIGDIYCFIDKIGVKNIGREMIAKLVDYGFIKTFDDLFDLDYIAVAKLEGFGKTSATNFKKELDKVFSKPIKDYNLIGSLNIELVGRGRTKLIFEKIPYSEFIAVFDLDDNDVEDITLMTKRLAAIPNIGSETVSSLMHNFYDLYPAIKVLIENGQIIVEETYVKRDKSFVSKSFCHTGSASPLKDRAAIKELLEARGHKLIDSVSKNTNYLINNDTASTTSKNKKAKDLNVPIISVQEMLDIVG